MSDFSGRVAFVTGANYPVGGGYLARWSRSRFTCRI